MTRAVTATTIAGGSWRVVRVSHWIKVQTVTENIGTSNTGQQNTVTYHFKVSKQMLQPI